MLKKLKKDPVALSIVSVTMLLLLISTIGNRVHSTVYIRNCGNAFWIALLTLLLYLSMKRVLLKSNNSSLDKRIFLLFVALILSAVIAYILLQMVFSLAGA